MSEEKRCKHPGGLEMTRYLIDISGIGPCKILDMGAGKGEAVKLLDKMGFEASGIDLNSPCIDLNSLYESRNLEGADFDSSPLDSDGKACVIEGNMHDTGFPEESFDAIISECAFFVSGDNDKAIKEAFRILKKSGKLLLADVYDGNEDAFRAYITEGGFRVLYCEDIKEEWKSYYIDRIWDGTADEICDIQPGDDVSKRIRYYLSVSERM